MIFSGFIDFARSPKKKLTSSKLILTLALHFGGDWLAWHGVA